MYPHIIAQIRPQSSSSVTSPGMQFLKLQITFHFVLCLVIFPKHNAFYWLTSLFWLWRELGIWFTWHPKCKKCLIDQAKRWHWYMRSYKANWCLFIDFLSEYILTSSLLCNLPFYLYSVSAETTKATSVLHRGTCQQEEAYRWQHLISMFCLYEELSPPLKPCPCTRNHSALYALVALDIACHT